MRPAALLLLAGLFAGPAYAENPVIAKMQAYMATPRHRDLVQRALALLPADVLPRCPTLHAGETQVTLLKPLSFGPDGVPDGGIWRESIPVSGCGNDTTLHLAFSAAPDDKIDTGVLLPGGTLADPILQADGVRYADAEAALLIGGCTAFDVTDTRLDGTPPAPGKPWLETWTLAGCGQSAPVAMHFTPTATGTTIAAGPSIP